MLISQLTYDQRSEKLFPAAPNGCWFLTTCQHKQKRFSGPVCEVSKQTPVSQAPHHDRHPASPHTETTGPHAAPCGLAGPTRDDCFPLVCMLDSKQGRWPPAWQGQSRGHRRDVVRTWYERHSGHDSEARRIARPMEQSESGHHVVDRERLVTMFHLRRDS